MKVASELNLPEGKVSIFRMNNKYIIKVENAHLEQTFKINELDFTIADVEDAEKILDADFMKEILENFKRMSEAMYKSLDRNGFC